MKHYKILIVEDEKITALDLKMTLEELGHQVAGSTGMAEKAIDLVEKLNPDLVLMDIQLEGAMPGTEAASIIHQRFGIPIVFLTAYTDDNTLDDACRSLAYGYMVKPFEKREVAAAIRIAMSRATADYELQKSEERLRLALDSARMKIWEWKPDTVISAEPDAPSDPSTFYLGFEQLLDRVYPDDQDNLQRLLCCQSQYRRLLRYRQDSGDYRWSQLMASIVVGRDGQKSVVGVVHDIHDDYEAQSRLRQAEVVFNSTREAILVTDARFQVIRVNPAFSDITGYASEAIIGRTPDIMMHARRPGDMHSGFQDSRESWSGEVACRRADGDVFPAWEHISRITDADGVLTGFIFNVSDISALRRAEKRLEQLAFVDSLTGLANRVQLERALVHKLSQCSPTHRLALLYLDLDGFKQVNDTLGHGKGDQLLVEISQRLRNCLRETDVIARVGGDEFVMVIDVQEYQDLDVMATRILAVVASPVSLGNEDAQVSGSLGAVLTEESSASPENLIKAADSAMFEAKKQGKNRWYFYDPDLDRELKQRTSIEQALPEALASHQFVLGYQPLMAAGTHRVRGVEALIRWQHPQLGLLLPERFIPAAEQGQLINDIGYWVLGEACRTLRDWELMGLTGLTMAVNISARQMSDKNFPRRLQGILERFMIRPAQLELEITETALQASEPLLPQLEAVKRLGVHLAIDDFGSGYSSLSRLKELPFDRVKIDRAFIRDLPDSANDVEICKAILALCRVLGLSVTAEGIETPSQRDLLESLGCDVLQGFLFSPAIREQMLPDWVGHFTY